MRPGRATPEGSRDGPSGPETHEAATNPVQGSGQGRFPNVVGMPPPEIQVNTWVDPVVEARGHPADSAYVEIFWLPVLGPSATFLLRRLSLYLDMFPGGLPMDLSELSGQLGLGRPESRHAALPRAIDRCVRFGLARRPGANRLAVRRILGPLPAQRVNRLSPFLQSIHANWADEPSGSVRPGR
jgi:hypothetical protein